MSNQEERLRLALVALHMYQTPKRLSFGLTEGLETAERFWTGLESDTRNAIETECATLLEQGVDVIPIEDPRYPTKLSCIRGAPPLLFAWGNEKLLSEASVGMCGSRNVSEKGLEAARVCGQEVTSHDFAIVSGYAKGVDSETQLASLEAGGRAIIVLAEGIRRFRVKRAFRQVGFDSNRVLVLSQFPPSQVWNVGAAMARNAVIVGLGQALVVIEAGETGGTLDAGRRALAAGRPVLALEFSEGTPEGNKLLFEEGALRIDRRSALGKALGVIGEPDEKVSVRLMRLF